jgi:hypothetical protein
VLSGAGGLSKSKLLAIVEVVLKDTGPEVLVTDTSAATFVGVAAFAPARRQTPQVPPCLAQNVQLLHVVQTSQLSVPVHCAAKVRRHRLIVRKSKAQTFVRIVAELA